MPPRRNNQLPAPVEPPLPAYYEGEEPLPPMDPPPEFLEEMNGVSTDDYGAPQDVVNNLPADPEVRRAEPVLKPTGAFMELGFIEQINAAPTDEEAKAMYDALDPAMKRVYDRSYGMNVSPEWAAGVAQEYYKEQDERMKAQREREAQAQDPVGQADLAAKQADAASKQLGLQDAYLQEMEYQSHLNTVMNSGASRAERQAAISAIDGLATAIGKRTMGAGAGSRDAMQAGKKAVGFIDWKQEYNPFADYTPQVDVMRRGSENRIGAIRQQMEAAGAPVPEFKGAPPPPEPNQIVVKQFGMKREDGTPITFRGAPVIRTAEGGKEVYERLGTDGKFYTLTEKEITELTGGQ
jgi:hypothetical protein